MDTPAATVEPYEPLPAPCYFAHRDSRRLSVVYGGLADYYGFYDVETFTGTDSQDEAQRANPANWQYFSEDQYAEVLGKQEPQIFTLLENTADLVEYQTEKYPGPFRLAGCVPFTATNDYEYYATLRELVEKQLRQSGEQFKGRIVPYRGRLGWVAYTEEPFGSGECPWVGIELNLGAPLASYTYYQGRRATVQEGQGHGTHTLWQQQDGERRYYVETTPVDPVSPSYPKLTPLTWEQVAQWYKFEFTPLN